MTNQEVILLSLIQSEAGRDFASRNAGWEADNDPCSWFGISCNSEEEVTGISLTGYDLQASLPSMLSELSKLQKLILVNCGMSGTFPLAVAQMTSLQELDLSLNHLTGEIPLFTSTSLTILSFAQNKLLGPIPPFGTMPMPDLSTINLKGNLLSGTVPVFSDYFTSLRHIDLSQNKLEGRLPTLETQQLPSLVRLYLSENSFSGTLPATFSESLREIHLQNNQLTGTIPAAWATLSGLQVLLLHNNRLTGEIPEALCALYLNAAFFTSNSIANSDENGIGRRRHLDSVVNGHGRDGCSSIACPAGFVSNVGHYPCTPCENPTMNPYLGASTCNDFAQDEILDILYASTGGQSWIDPSWNNSNKSACSRTGITCDGEGNVIGLSLKSYGLVGTLPSELGYLPNLLTLDVRNNNLSGHLPEELALAPLQSLLIAENNLSGYVPDALCRKKGINGNGDNHEFSCDNIACPMGTHHPEGHATPSQRCEPCPIVDGLVLANTGCRSRTSRDSKVNETNGEIPEWSMILLVTIVGALLILLGFLVLRKVATISRPPRINDAGVNVEKTFNGFQNNPSIL